MNGARICERCEKPLSETATENICAACIAQLGHAPWLEGTAATVALADESRPGPTNPPAATSGAAEIREFGDYKLVEEIARGGMGIVYKARQVSLDRIVAVKMILAGQFAGKQITQRFRGEATAAAVLHHPNIVAVHEVGVHEGHHFFSMDFVEGQNLAQLVGNRPLPARKAARYLKLLAEAIHYAHGQGILHRDLKPSNVLVEAATDQPRVTDFGLAKRLDAESSLTMSGQVLGSPHFMPPEQASGGRGKVGRQSDVFGLGAVLYFLLTARAPFQGDTLETTIHQVLHADPVSPRLLNPAVSQDLETICLKCLEKEPERRYATAQEVADELERFLRDEPIRARPVSRAERAWRWCRRKPVVATLSAATLLLLLTVSIGAPIAAIRIAQGRQEAKNKANELEENLYFSRVALAYGDVTANQPARALKLLEACPEKLRDWEWNYVRNRCYQPAQHIAQTSGRVLSLTVSPKRHDVAVVAGEELQLWELTDSEGLKQRATLGPVATIGYESVFWVAFSPDGVYLAAVSTNHAVKLWHVTRRAELQTFIGHTNVITAVAFNPNGREIATGANDVRVWDVASGRSRVLGGLDFRGVSSLAYSPNGQWLAAGTFGPPLVRIWDAHTGEKLFDFRDYAESLTSLAFSPDSQWLATGSGEYSVKVWEMSTRKMHALLLGHSGYVNSLAFSPTGVRLVSTSTDREVKIWDVRTKREVLSLAGHTNNVAAVAFAANGRKLISGGFDRTLRVWDTTSVKLPDLLEPETLTGHSNRVFALAFTHDGRLVSAGGDCNGFVWDRVNRQSSQRFQSRFDVSVSSDGRNIVTQWNLASGGQSYVSILDASTLQERYRTSQPSDSTLAYNCGALSPDGNYLVTGGEDTEVTVWDWRNGGRSNVLFRTNIMITDVKFSPDGRYLASMSEDGTVMLWDAKWLPELWKENASSAKQQGRVLLPATALREFARVAFSPDSARLASGDGFDGVVVVDVATGGRVLPKLRGHGGIVLCVAFSLDGRFLASSGTDHTVRLWDARTGNALRTFFGHTGIINALAFSADNRLLASGSQDQTIKLWRLDFE